MTSLGLAGAVPGEDETASCATMTRFRAIAGTGVGAGVAAGVGTGVGTGIGVGVGMRVGEGLAVTIGDGGAEN